MADPRPRAGFSLLELLFSLSIMAVGLLFAATLFPVGQRRVNHGMSRERAAMQAAKALEVAKSISYDSLPDLHDDLYDDRHYYDVDGDSLNLQQFDEELAEALEWWWVEVEQDVPKEGLTTVTAWVTWMEHTSEQFRDNYHPDQPNITDGPDPQFLKVVLLVSEDY